MLCLNTPPVACPAPFSQLPSKPPASLLDGIPPLLPESLIHRFTFYFHRSLRQGMRYGCALYELAYESQSNTRHNDAYQIACDLRQQQLHVLMTASPMGCCVWVNLRSSGYTLWATQRSFPPIRDRARM